MIVRKHAERNLVFFQHYHRVELFPHDARGKHGPLFGQLALFRRVVVGMSEEPAARRHDQPRDPLFKHASVGGPSHRLPTLAHLAALFLSEQTNASRNALGPILPDRVGLLPFLPRLFSRTRHCGRLRGRETAVPLDGGGHCRLHVFVEKNTVM